MFFPVFQCFSSIKSAVAEAPPDAIILVHPGTYIEENSLDSKVAIIGTGRISISICTPECLIISSTDFEIYQ